MKKLIVLFASVALVLSFAATASADWNFYGSARMTTFWNDQDAAAGDDDELTFAQQGNSRIGASVKGDAVGGGFEYGTGINLRKLYGTWNFGGGTLLVGQTYTPVNLFMSNQVYGGDAGLLNYGGGIYGGRHGMLQVSFGPVKIALVDPQDAAVLGTVATGADEDQTGAESTGAAHTHPTVATKDDGEGDSTIPKLEASFGFKTDMFSLTVVGGYQTYSVEGASTGDYDVDAYTVAAQVNVGLGPAKIKVAAGFAQNAADYGLWLNDAEGAVIDANGKIQDEDSVMFGASVSFKATDMLSLEGGASYYQHEPGGGGEDDGMAYYVQCVINPAPGVYIIPEVGVLDNGDDTAGEDEGSTTYIGAKWQINF